MQIRVKERRNEKSFHDEVKEGIPETIPDAPLRILRSGERLRRLVLTRTSWRVQCA